MAGGLLPQLLTLYSLKDFKNTIGNCLSKLVANNALWMQVVEKPAVVPGY